MERPTKRRHVARGDSDDEVAVVSEKFVKAAGPRDVADDDDVVFVKETRAPASTRERAAPSVNEYIAIRDGTIPKILGRTARMKRPARKPATPKLGSPRVASIAEYTRAMGLVHSDEDEDEEEGDEEDEEEGFRRKRTKRRLEYDDSSDDDDDHGGRKKRKQAKLQRKTRSVRTGHYSNLSPKARHARSIDRSPRSVLVGNLGGSGKASAAKRRRTPRKRLARDGTCERRRHRQRRIPQGELPPRIAAVAAYVNELLESVEEGDIDEAVDDEVEAFASSGGTTWKLESWSDFDESDESDADVHRAGIWPYICKSARTRSCSFANERFQEHFINTSAAYLRGRAQRVEPPPRVASIAQYARARMKYRHTPSVSNGSSSSRKKELPLVSLEKRFRNIDDSDDFSNTESEELFIRRVAARERDEAQLVELPPGVASINEYVGANLKYRPTRAYNDEERRDKKRRSNPPGNSATWPKHRLFEDADEL